MVGPKFLLSWVEMICLLIITTSPTDLKDVCMQNWSKHVDKFACIFLKADPIQTQDSGLATFLMVDLNGFSDLILKK